MAEQLGNKAGKTAGRLLRFMDDHLDDEISFEKFKSQHRGITLEIYTKRFITTGAVKTERCDMGHDHVINVQEKIEHAHIYFDEADIKKLRKFLNDNKWLEAAD